MYICIYVYMYICIYVCMYVCMYVCIYVCMYVPQAASAVGVLAVHLGTGYLVHRQILCFCAFIFVRRLRERWGSRRSRLRETARSRRFCCKTKWFFMILPSRPVGPPGELPGVSGCLLGACWVALGYFLGASWGVPGVPAVWVSRRGQYVYVCMYICIYVYMYVRIYVYMHVCMYVCMLFWNGLSAHYSALLRHTSKPVHPHHNNDLGNLFIYIYR